MVTALRRLASRLHACVRARDLDRDFEQELESHLTLLTEENIRRGMSPDQARRAAAVRLGGRTSLQAQHRDARGLPGLAALALGIGANATGFTIVNAVFLRGLPFEESDGLHVLSWQHRST